MNDFLIKLKYVYLRYLITSIFFVFLYTFLVWLFIYRFEIININEEIHKFWLPFILSFIIMFLFFWRRLSLLWIGIYNENTKLLYYFVASISIIAPIIILQDYIESKNSELKQFDSVFEIEEAESTDWFKISSFEVDNNNFASYYNYRYTGKYNSDINFNAYYLFKFKSTDELNSDRDVFYAIHFNKQINVLKNQDFLNSHFQAFINNSLKRLNNYNFNDVKYFKGISKSVKRNDYLTAIYGEFSKKVDNVILLAPTENRFDNRIGRKLIWVLISFGIGAFIFLIMILIPGVDKGEFRRLIKNQPSKEDGFYDYFKILIPYYSGYTTTPIVILIKGIMIMIFIFAGISINTPTTKELIYFGALTSDFSGNFYQILLYPFLYQSIYYLMTNIAVFGILSYELEKQVGGLQTAIIIFISYTISTIVFLLFSQNILAVDLSGIVFGVTGAIIFFSIFDKDFDDTVILYLGIAMLFYLIIGILGSLNLYLILGGLIGGLLSGFSIMLISGKSFSLKS